jgi:putative transposase
MLQRGNHRQVLVAADADYRLFREALVEAATEYGLALHAYVWMTHPSHWLAARRYRNITARGMR